MLDQQLSRSILKVLILVCALFLSACETQVDQSEAFRPPREQALPTSTELPIPATPTSVGDCFNDARFLEDLTIPDGTRVLPGEVIDKRWSLQNNGTCDWGSGYRLLRRDDSAIQGGEEQALYPARQGALAIWQVELVAPQEEGEYLASWQALSPEGESFGDVVFILIVVDQDADTLGE